MIAGTLSAPDGVAIAYERWPGAAPTALYVHATGFCKEMWLPVRNELDKRGISIGGMAVDQRAHGDSGLSLPPFHWSALGRDVAVARAAVAGPVVGVGHSSGGAALCMAEVEAPGTFQCLVLIEPIIFPGPHVRLEENPMTDGALRRRPSFDSIEDARAVFREKGAFAEWTDAALEAYVRHAFRADDGRWVLKCSPESEAEFYREGFNHNTWEWLPEIGCPVLVIVGERSEAHPAAFAAQLVARFSNGDALIVPGATHFVPMERPDVIAAALAQMVS